jgi:hypothetical protein
MLAWTMGAVLQSYPIFPTHPRAALACTDAALTGASDRLVMLINGGHAITVG